MTIDLITVWPRNCDYPLWRQLIRDTRAKYGKVIIVFMETNAGPNYMDFIRGAMVGDDITFIEPQPTPPGEDWRHIATNAALAKSDGDWVFFTEEDFYPGIGFDDQLDNLSREDCDVMAVYQGPRMHPCCIYIKRNVLEKTHKNFAIVPDKTDHFYLIQKDLEDNKALIGIINQSTYFHYNGLSHNQNLANTTGEPNYETPTFVDWLKQSLNVSVPQDPMFEVMARAVISKYGTGDMPKSTPPDHSPTAN